MKSGKRSGAEPELLDLCAKVPASEQHRLRELLARLLDKWSLWVLAELCDDGPLRFSRLLERLEGVSQKSLTATLRTLERDGLVSRTVVVQVPIRVDYAATEVARSLVKQIQPVWSWAVEHSPTLAVNRSRFDRKHKPKTGKNETC